MKRYVMLFVLLVLLSGCVQSEILDDISLEIGRGYDRAEGDLIEGTTLIYNFQPDKTVENVTASAIAATSRDLINNLQRQSSNPISEGSLEVFLFSKELAQDGLIDYLDAPQRNPSIGARLFLVVVDGSTKELLNSNFGFRGNAMFLSELLRHNIKQEDLPKTNLHLFFHDYYQLGRTGYMPMVKKMSDKHLELQGLGLFTGNKLQMVDTVEKEKMFFFKLMVDKYSEGAHMVKIDRDIAVIRSISSKHKLILTKKKPYQITLKIKVDGIIREHTGKKLTPAIIKKIEQYTEEEITRECEKLIKGFQEKKIDPVGFGFFIRTRDRKAHITEEWENSDAYQSLEVKVKTDVKILESGVTE
ncbi:Ger(x)C family spore germination protein [Pseudoneobacillus sp. C159]